MTRSPRKMAPRRKGRQTSISDFFSTPPRPPKRPQSLAQVEEQTKLVSAAPADDVMDVEGPSDPAEELTQEELHVHDQLESLGCSKKRPRGTPPDDTDETPPRGEPSDGDDSDDSLNDIEQSAALRRSTRITREVVRYGSAFDRPRGGSVFGDGITKARSNTNDLKRALREINQHAKREEHLAEMWKQVNEAETAGQDEELFKEMADAEERDEKVRREAYNKYSAPVPLFCRKVKMRPLSKKQKRKRSGTFACHPVHDLLMQAMKSGDDNADIALSVVVPVVKRYCQSRDIKGLARMTDYLFQLAVYDTTDDKPGRLSRDFLVDAIDDIVKADINAFRSAPQLPRLEPVMAVLEKFGAVFKDGMDLRRVGDFGMAEDGLDKQVPIADTADSPEDDDGNTSKKGDDRDTQEKRDDETEDAEAEENEKDEDDSTPPPVSDEFNRCERNLGRLFRIAALQVRRGVPLGLVLTGEKSSLRDSVLCSLGMCTRVLLSAFGNRLYNHVGELINASLTLIDEEEWPEFRMKAAAYIHSFTTRLELHVELVTYLLPYTHHRSRSLSFDIAYLSLQQWCSSNEPSTITTSPSAEARELGTRKMSFCLSDIVRHIQAVPEITRNTDMIWLSLLARLLKVVLSESFILERRGAGELGALKNELARMKVSCRRQQLDVPVQRMRLALDAIERIIQEFASGREKRELRMDIEERRQGNLGSLRATV